MSEALEEAARRLNLQEVRKGALARLIVQEAKLDGSLGAQELCERAVRQFETALAKARAAAI
jgi:hypothetical protein